MSQNILATSWIAKKIILWIGCFQDGHQSYTNRGLRWYYVIINIMLIYLSCLSYDKRKCSAGAPPEIIPGGHGYGTHVQEVVSICKEWVYYEIGQSFLNYSMCQKSYPFIKNEFAMKIGQDSLDIHFNETKVNIIAIGID